MAKNGFLYEGGSRIASMASEPTPPPVQKKYDFADLSIAGITGLALALTMLFLCAVPLTDIAGKRDFVAFWATGQQLAHHGNPYDRDAMMRIERSVGAPVQDEVLFMRNLPWALPLAYPLGFIGLGVAAFLWSLALLACLLLSVRILWQMHGRPGNYLHWLGVSFAPALLCLMMGQTSLFALLGYVLFLSLHRNHPFAAGISLWLCALKPHLFLSVGIVLLLWILLSKSYKLLLGVVAALAASCTVLYLIDPTAWIDYARMMRIAGIGGAHVPCLSVALRFWLRPQMAAFTYLPAALGCVWALGYFWWNRHRWDWMKNGSLLLLVSLLTAPYAWVYDDGLAIPALLHGAYLTRSRILLAILAFASCTIEVELLSGVKIQSNFYLWTAPTWLLWYLCAARFTKAKEEKTAA